MSSQSLFPLLIGVNEENMVWDSRGLCGACDPQDYKSETERCWACWLLWCHSEPASDTMLLIIHGPVTTCLSSCWSHVALWDLCYIKASSRAGTMAEAIYSTQINNIIPLWAYLVAYSKYIHLYVCVEVIAIFELYNLLFCFAPLACKKIAEMKFCPQLNWV